MITAGHLWLPAAGTGYERTPVWRGVMGDRGGIITGWLLQLLAILAVIAVIAYEGLAIGVTAVSAEDNAREFARAARDAYRTGDMVAATEGAEEVSRTHGVEVVAVEVDGDSLVATIDKQARTLLVHRIGPLEDLSTQRATARARVRP